MWLTMPRIDISRDVEVGDREAPLALPVAENALEQVPETLARLPHVRARPDRTRSGGAPR